MAGFHADGDLAVVEDLELDDLHAHAVHAGQLDQGLPDLNRFVPGEIKFESIFAGLTGAGNQSVHPTGLTLGEAVVSDVLQVNINVGL